ncbi:neuroligin-like protein glit-1 isoform X1 [Diorhabda sublineata]|uniref:neuroligin-like protein glit-1 isoform X1 n=2 Tax=Diorhabda sublineata TaxID=1163346 RepID=UPI0024E0E79E|nr:neuroligin-like protein glit-1 isoform X1 [Diorhabda sublineata]
MAPPSRKEYEIIVTLLIIFLSDIVGLGQYDHYTSYSSGYPPNVQNPYNEYGPRLPYNPNNPFDNRVTYVYKGRRYGQNYNTNYYNQGRPGDPRIKGQDERFTYDRAGNAEPILPGILGSWREDLQGKAREQTREQPRDVFVETSHGTVQGFQVYLFDNPDPESLYRPGAEFIERQQGIVSTFLGIPYAQPPVLEGRFKPPRLHRGWQIMQAVDFGPACPQPIKYTGVNFGIRDVDEDCLYLNVFTPDITKGTGHKYPVMFYIHGGDFIKGASNTFPGHILATFYKVVVVTINYRLGALGFLSTGDVNSPGNYGILDQAMALRWIYDNAGSFNGDRNSITLFGPGAGAASAGLLMVAPQTRHIVTQVIAQSGSAVADWAMIFDKYRAQNTSRVFGRQIGCSIESSWKLVNCLKNSRSAYEIGNAEFPPEVGLFPWAPVIEMNVSMPFYEGWYEKDWHFITESVETLIKKRAFNQGLRYMSSVTLQEAAGFITSNKTLEPNFIVTQEFFDLKVKELVLRYNYTLNPYGIFDAIKYMYTYWPDPTNVTHIRNEYIQLLSDFLYTAPNDKIVKLLIDQNVPVYMYVLNTTIESFNLEEWRKVPHNIEHYLLCGAPFLDVEMLPANERFVRNQWTRNDRNMSHFFMKAYSDFARYGNPSHTQILGLHFEESKHGQLKYLNLNTTYNSSIMWNFRQTETAFWSQYIPTLVGHLIPTYPPTTEFWWEPRAPLQIAFWSISGICLLLIVLLVICCMLWRNAKRSSDRYYNPYLYPADTDTDNEGIENNRRTEDNEYIEKYGSRLVPPLSNSATSFHSMSMKEMQGFVNKNANGETHQHKKGTPVVPPKFNKSRELPLGVPQTDV